MFHDDVLLPPNDPTPSPDQDFPLLSHFQKGHFSLVSVTPHFLALVDALIDRSADFDRSLAEQGTSKLPDMALDSYGDLIRTKGTLVEYVAALMDLAKDQNLNRRRTAQVRFK